MLKKYRYSGKYLPKELVESCFTPSQYTFVDKRITGNGFTTAFLKIKPSYKTSNIIIVPNKEVVKSKQESHHHTLRYGTKEEISELPNIGFFYGDASADKLKFCHFDVMMFVVDSFLNYQEEIIHNKNLIDKILIDEVHSMIIQSSFRNRLVGFLDDIKANFKDKEIVCVTATPMLFNKVDIELIPSDIKRRKINVSSNQNNSLKRLKSLIDKGENVVVALQDVRILKKLADKDGVLNANIKVGETLYRKIVESVILKRNNKSKLTVISSAGFEGFDVDNGLNNFFLFEDRAFDYQTFYSQNLIQAIGRSRKGTKYIEWCRMPNFSRTEMMSKEDMIKKAESTKISFEKKMTDKNYTFIPKYFDYNQDISLGLITDLNINHIKYDLAKELQDTDLKGVSVVYNKFLNDRGFDLVYLNEGHKRMNLKNVSHKIAFKNMKLNEDTIKRYSLMSGIKLNLWQKEKLDYYIKEYEIYFRRKYWMLEQLPFEEDFNLDHATHVSKIETYDSLKRELFAYSILKDESSINEACKLICKESILNKKESINERSEEFKIWKRDLLNNIKDRYIRLIMTFSQNNIKLPKKIRNSRDYNLLTEVSTLMINAVADLFDTSSYEIDIISCNSRIIYSMVGLPLPQNFYGKNKVNKIKINKLLNKLSYEFPKMLGLNIKDYKNKRIQEMRVLGFDEKVIEFLISTFWDKPRDSVFNFCAYHEKRIIDKLKEEIDKGERRGMIRRHDSIMYFGEMNESQLDVVLGFEYNGQYGWFRDYDLISEYTDIELPQSITQNYIN